MWLMKKLIKFFLVRTSLVGRILKMVFLFVVTYHPKVKKLGKLIKDLLPFLYSDEEVQKVFSPPPMVSYRSARKIKDYLIRSKLYPLERNVDCGGCGNGRCQVCENIKITEHLTVLLLKKATKLTIDLTAMISA